MLKLLVVDDEDITRFGIISFFNWSEMGIGSIEQAENGIEALTIANDFVPDILLTDLRMPHMDGIELSFKLRTQFPNIKIIFMSAYTDKEYLKSAIQIKAINYVEKPLNLNELKQTLESTVSLCVEEIYKKQTENELISKLNTYIPIAKNELALLLTKDKHDLALIDEKFKNVNLAIDCKSKVNTIVVKFFYNNILNIPIDIILNQIENFFCSEGLISICGLKDENLLVIHLISKNSKNHSIATINYYCTSLLSFFSSNYNVFIAFGKTVIGFENISESYRTAIISLQKCFFRGYGSIVVNNETDSPQFCFSPNQVSDFSNLLISGAQDQLIKYIMTVTFDIKRHDDTMVSNVKDFYFRLFKELKRTTDDVKISLWEKGISENYMWEILRSCNTLFEIEKLLIDKVNLFFSSLNELRQNTSITNEILKYIHDNYQNKNLSLNIISEHMHMVPSYICTLFKANIGKTVIQYITEYRIEKSLDLLRNRQYKIQYIAEAVGCYDSNYFTKLFRKVKGITPSEYKEKYFI